MPSGHSQTAGPALKFVQICSSISQRVSALLGQQRMKRMARQVAAHAPQTTDQAPVILFNASTRISGMSLNAAFSLLAAWGLRLNGVPVIHFVCDAGMQHCVLGINRQDYTQPPPCKTCIAQSRRLYTQANVHTFQFQRNSALESAFEGLGVAELSNFIYRIPPKDKLLPAVEIPLGSLVLPSLRWTLRRHTLPDDDATRYLFRTYILSAYHTAQEFAGLITKSKPQAAIFFNGIMFPEASARWVARQMGLRTIAHEVGFLPFSAFFTTGEPTAYPIDIPDTFELSQEQNARLDAYLEKRFKGEFTMAGIRFWPEMQGLGPAFQEKANRFRQIVPVFTNVIYDTSQIHANVIFEHMFAWLDQILAIIQLHKDTLFVIRAHPDEMRPGSAKQSQESVRDWVRKHQVDQLPNVIFIDSQEYISSYDLIQRSKFVMVYNSSIGLEAALMGVPVLCGGKARYTQYPIVFFPQTQDDYRQQAETFLTSDAIDIPAAFQRNARRFLYYQLYRTSLPLDAYIETTPSKGFVRLRSFSWQELQPENSPAMKVLLEGILQAKPFLLPGT